MVVVGAVVCLFFSLLLLPSPALSIQCILNHEFTIDRYKDISMVKSTCYAAKYCVSVHYEDKNRMKKQGYSVGCDRTDCEDELAIKEGWTTDEDGHMCKKHKDYGSEGSICCCKKDFCNGGTTTVTSLLSLLIPLLSSVVLA